MDQEAQNTKKEIPNESDIQENPENNEKVNAESETNEKTNEKLAKKYRTHILKMKTFRINMFGSLQILRT